MGGPLEGMRILDLTQVQAGPSCTQLLAWLGADVIKIEEPGVGDRTREEMAHEGGVDSFHFLVFNANKKSLCLDLKSSDGRNIFKRLVCKSDVVVENFGPRGMEKLGLAYDELKRVNPRIVYASIKGFGTYGPYAPFKSFEYIAQAMGGAISMNGEAGGGPLLLSSGVADSGSGLHCAIGILAAVYRRDRAGVGDYVEVSMQDAVVNISRARMVDSLATNQPMRRAGNRSWGLPSVLYPCNPGGPDDYVTIYIGGEAWDSLLAVIDCPDFIGDARYATREARIERAGEVEAMITRWTSVHTKREVMDALNEIGIPCGAVLNTREVLEDPHLRKREMVVEVNDHNRGRYLALGCPIKMASGDAKFMPPPLLGEHSAEVLSTVLGFDSNELEGLRKSGVISADR